MTLELQSNASEDFNATNYGISIVSQVNANPVVYLVAWDLDTTQRMKFYRGYDRLVGDKWRKEGTLSVREFSDKALAERVHALAKRYGRSKMWEAREVVA